ncbi:hypothetical protein BD410DRAFT_822676 [Rickenella mellea]|uniref:G domain-containing protein n=1 Tax=Rickenella mellea TaxID=50990 RepID=A0A4Y7PQC8_9AGAM|nr:hypothetical protein BD410DRAFT_822676 [Rickenella mellea]
MGKTGSGKTTFINLVSGSQHRVGSGLRSCTSTVQVAKLFEIDDYVVTLIDTPGFDDTIRSDVDILNMIASFLVTAYEAGHLLSGIIYMHPISDVRMGGVSTRNFRLFRKLCGEAALCNVVIVTSMWGRVPENIGQERENELATDDVFFKPVITAGARMLRHDGTLQCAQSIIHQTVTQRALPFQIQRELHDQKLHILQTSAGAELNQQLRQQAEKHREEMEALEKDIRDARCAEDEEAKKVLEEARRKLRDELRSLAYRSEKIALQTRLSEAEEVARQRSKRQEEESNRRISELQDAMAQAESNSAYQLTQMRQELAALRNQSANVGLVPTVFGFFGALSAALGVLVASQVPDS